MKVCLKSCGDWARAKNFPGCRRTGTRKSRAPSGVRVSSKRPDVDEALLLHRIADGGDHRGGETQVPLHAVAPQVEVAIPKPRRLLDSLVVELEGKRLRASDDLELVDLDLDFARGDVRVDCVGRARTTSPRA